MAVSTSESLICSMSLSTAGGGSMLVIATLSRQSRPYPACRTSAVPVHRSLVCGGLPPLTGNAYLRQLRLATHGTEALTVCRFTELVVLDGLAASRTIFVGGGSLAAGRRPVIDGTPCDAYLLASARSTGGVRSPGLVVGQRVDV